MRAWLFRPLSPLASHAVIAALAVITWVFVIVPLWRFFRRRFSLSGLGKMPIAVSKSATRLLSQNKSLTRLLVGAATALLVFALGLWAGSHSPKSASPQMQAQREKAGDKTYYQKRSPTSFDQAFKDLDDWTRKNVPSVPSQATQLFWPQRTLSLATPSPTSAQSTATSPAPSASPSPIKTEVSYRFSVEKGAVTLADAKSGSVLATTTIERWGRPASTQDQLRHVALDITAAVVAGNGGREHTVDPNSPVYTMDEATKAPAVTATVENGAIFFIQSDTYTNGRYQALIGNANYSGVPRIKTKEEFEKLPVGSVFIDDGDGEVYQKGKEGNVPLSYNLEEI